MSDKSKHVSPLHEATDCPPCCSSTKSAFPNRMRRSRTKREKRGFLKPSVSLSGHGPAEEGEDQLVMYAN